jgi:hypothetical protein
MKKLMLLIVLLVAANGFDRLTTCCFAADPPIVSAVTLWAGMSNPLYEETSYDILAGYRRTLTTSLDIELGIIANYIPDRYALGGYGMLHYTGELVDVPNPIDVDWLPDTLIGSPFIGFLYMFSLDTSARIMAPIGGARIFDALTIYYKYSFTEGEPIPDNGSIGLSLEFKF